VIQELPPTDPPCPDTSPWTVEQRPVGITGEGRRPGADQRARLREVERSAISVLGPRPGLVHPATVLGPSVLTQNNDSTILMDSITIDRTTGFDPTPGAPDGVRHLQ